MAKQRKHRFVVGYKKDNDCIAFGKDHDYFKGAIPLTSLQAKRKVKPTMCAGMVIFELVELKG